MSFENNRKKSVWNPEVRQKKQSEKIERKRRSEEKRSLAFIGSKQSKIRA